MFIKGMTNVFKKALGACARLGLCLLQASTFSAFLVFLCHLAPFRHVPYPLLKDFLIKPLGAQLAITLGSL